MSAVSLLPEAQTFTSVNWPTSSFEAFQYLVVGNITSPLPSEGVADPVFTIGNIGGDFYSWLRFDLSSIPPTAVITSATLTMTSLYARHADYTSLAFGCRRCTDITFAETITNNTAPFASLTGGFYIGYMPTGGPNIDVTANVKVMTANALSTGKLSIYVSGSGVADDWGIVQSSKFEGVATPVLSVSYYEPLKRQMIVSHIRK
jgi:hypothetical protein